jgi:hypothetical protein
MWEIFLEGHVLSVGGDALICIMYYIPAYKLYAGWLCNTGIVHELIVKPKP